VNPFWRVETKRSQRSYGCTAPLLAVGDHTIDAVHGTQMYSGAVAKNEIGLTCQFATAAGAAARVGAGAVPPMPFEGHVTKRESFSLLPRTSAIDLTHGSPLLEEITPRSQIGGQFWRGWVLLVLKVTWVIWVTTLIINGFSG
jgi:hypothetical protein